MINKVKRYAILVHKVLIAAIYKPSTRANNSDNNFIQLGGYLIIKNLVGTFGDIGSFYAAIYLTILRL